MKKLFMTLKGELKKHGGVSLNDILETLWSDYDNYILYTSDYTGVYFRDINNGEKIKLTIDGGDIIRGVLYSHS